MSYLSLYKVQEPEVMNCRQRKYQGVQARSKRTKQAAVLVAASELCNHQERFLQEDVRTTAGRREQPSRGKRRLAPTCCVPREPRSPAEDRRRGREGCKAPKHRNGRAGLWGKAAQGLTKNPVMLRSITVSWQRASHTAIPPSACAPFTGLCSVSLTCWEGKGFWVNTENLPTRGLWR